MLGINRNKRPVELGPYPLETLRRDPSVLAEELLRTPKTSGLSSNGSATPLVRATLNHLEAYKELREPEPFAKLAPVPKDLALRTRDIKGAGYFADASQIGICEMPNNGWSGNNNTTHQFAIVVLVEHSDPIDADNHAAEWISGNEHLLATLRAAEIAINLSGQISSMGYFSCAHWLGATDVDLEMLAVLSGLALREEELLVNPYVDEMFSLAVVTTDYALTWINLCIFRHGTEKISAIISVYPEQYPASSVGAAGDAHPIWDLIRSNL